MVLRAYQKTGRNRIVTTKTAFEKNREALQNLVHLAKGQAQLAMRLRKWWPKASQGQVWNWLNSKKGAPTDYVSALCEIAQELATEGQAPIGAHDLRGDIYRGQTQHETS